MINFFIKRMLYLAPVCVVSIFSVALMIRIIPGDPVDQLLGEFATLDEKNRLSEQLGLNLSPFEQINDYLQKVLTGNFGYSLIHNESVSSLILERLPATFELTIFSLIVAILMSLPLGTLAAFYRAKRIDYLATFFSLIGLAIPNFWLGPILILFFSIYLGWVPVSGRDTYMSYILPSLTMGASLSAFLSRITRTTLIENLHSDYIRTARAKGLSHIQIYFKHLLKNSSIPLVTTISLQFGALITGAVVTEKIFDWPGVGSLVIEAIGNRDYPLIQGCILFFTFSYLLVNMITDIIYSLMDPRIRW